MASDGQVLIDLLFPANKSEFKTDFDWANDLIKDFGKNAGEKMNNVFKSNVESVKGNAQSTKTSVNNSTSEMGKNAGEKMKNSFKNNANDMKNDSNDAKNKVNQNLNEIKKEVRTKLIASAEKTGIKDFGSLLNHIPKSEITKLEAKVQKGEEINWREEMSKMPRSIVTKMQLDDKQAAVGLDELKRQAKDTGGSFSHLKEIVAGSVIGNAISNGIGVLQAKMSSLITAGAQYNKTVQISLASWTTLTDSASKGKEMVDMATNLSTHFGQSRDIVDELDQQFYHVLDNSGKTETLTKSFLTLADTIGLSSDQVKTLGQDFTHTLSGGKLQIGDFNQTADYLPMFGENLLKYEQKVQNNSKLTMSQLRAEMSSGKISANDAMTVINQLGDKYKKSAENMMGTLPGMERAISAKAPQLVSAFINPFLTAENPIAKDVMKWVNDPKTMGEMEKGGKTFSSSLNGISKSIVAAFPNIKSIAGSLATITGIIGKTVWRTFSGAMGIIASAFGSTSNNAKKAESPLSNVANGFKALASQKGAIENVTKAFLAMMVVSKLKAFSSGLKDVAGGFSSIKSKMALLTSKDGIKSLLASLKPSPLTLYAAAAVAIGVGFYEAYKHIKPFRDWVNKSLEAIKEFSKRAYKTYIKPAIEDIMSTFDRWGKQLRTFWEKNGTTLEKALKNFEAVVKVVNIGVEVSLGAMKGVFEAVFGGIVRETKILWSTLKSLFSGGFQVLKGLVEVFEGVFTGNWNKIKQGGIDIIKGMWTAISGLFSGAVKTLGNLAETVGQAIINGVIGGLNGGINAIDSVIHMFGGAKHAIGDISPVKLSSGTGTRRPILKKTLALLNDGSDSPETGNKEMLIKKNGSAGIVQGKNVLKMLDEGDEVLNASETKNVMSFLGVERFASGTGLLRSIASGAKSIWNNVTDKLKAITEAIAHPIDFVKQILKGHSSFGIDTAIKFGNAMINGVAQGVESPIKKLLSSLKHAFESSGSGGGAVPSGDHQKLMQQAGIPSSWWSDMNWIVNVESGWKTNATNASSGAYGLPQSLPGSKMASAGSDWKTNPVTQLKWMYNYVKSRYGTAANAVAEHKVKGWYANGGDVPDDGIYRLEKGEKVVPNPSIAGIDRTYTVLGQAAAYTAAKSNFTAYSTSGIENKINIISQKLDQLGLLKTIAKKNPNLYIDKNKLIGSIWEPMQQRAYWDLKQAERGAAVRTSW